MSDVPARHRPRLRPVEAFPVVHEGQEFVALRDPAEWTEDVLLIPPQTVFLLSCLDGGNDLRDVQAACTRRFGRIVPLEAIEEVVAVLDRALLLDSPRFREHRLGIERAFREAATRPAAHAGRAYEGDPEALRRILDGHLATASLPGMAPGAACGLIAPHIDLHRGGAGYGAAYRALAERSDSDLFVILGTVHASPDEPYTATRKAYETPLGAVETDAAFLDALEARYGARLFAAEGAHRREHSIEFQALLLRHIAGDRPIRIVPILCSSFHEAVGRAEDPGRDGRVGGFLEALRATLRERPGACLVAAADLAHLGPRFGDGDPVSDATAAWCERRDRESLDAVGRRDAPGFFAGIAEERDERRVCGTSAIWTLLQALPAGSRGTLLHYGQALDAERTTFVSHASMIFIAPGPAA